MAHLANLHQVVVWARAGDGLRRLFSRWPLRKVSWALLEVYLYSQASLSGPPERNILEVDDLAYPRRPCHP